ncbi:hypothetical protein ACG7TL_006417 [Trametes sanguinea]
MFTSIAFISLALLGRIVHAGPLGHDSVARDVSLSLPVSELNIADARVDGAPTRGGLGTDTIQRVSLDPGSQIAICLEVNCQSCAVFNLISFPLDECTLVGQYLSTAFIDPTPPTFNLTVGTDFCAQEILIPERNVCFNVGGGPFSSFVIDA